MSDISSEALAAIESADKETLSRWYADLNRHRSPDDFPVIVPPYTGRLEADRWRTSPGHVYFAAVSDRLSEEEQSLAWWTHAMGKTEAEWRHWWANERSKP